MWGFFNHIYWKMISGNKEQDNTCTMANTQTICIFVFLLCLTADGAMRPYPIKSHNRKSLSFLDSDDGICKSMVEIVGYSCEEHTVTTNDGYILSVQRIPAGRSGTVANKPPVLLQHGLYSDASVWLINSPDEALAFILADNGYDVWLVSTRGTQYCSGHTSLSTDDPAYWEWSWDELAAYDLSASFQYVYDQTGQNLHYVGHSLGTLMGLAAFSQQQSVNMLRSAALLCPISYLNQIPTQLAKTAADSSIGNIMYWLGIHEFLAKGGAVTKFIEDICNEIHSDCSSVLPVLTGNSCCLNSSVTDEILNNAPQPTATKNMLHLAQMIQQGTIAMYDYGSTDKNNQHYGQDTPPAYNISSIPNELPLFLAHGGQDKLSDVNDVQSLLNTLQGHDADKLVVLYMEQYAHLDFIWSVTANQDVYNPLMAFFQQN